MKLLIHPAVDPTRLIAIREAAGSMSVVNAADANSALAEVVDADAFFGKITEPLLTAAERLQWVQSPTASLEHYLFPRLTEHPCLLTNMRGLFGDVIAQHVFGYILCFARNLHIYIRQQSESRWEAVGGESQRASFATGAGIVTDIDRAHIHLSDCTLGLVGLGDIGSQVARQGAAFGMRVVALDPIQRRPPEGVESVWAIDRLPRLLGESDFVVVAAPQTPDTLNMFGREQFRLMKPSSFFINIGRGAIVGLADLTAALQGNEIAGAGLDVFEIEPLPADHPLWRMDNVIITPHIAASSVRIAERHLATLLENVRRFVDGKPLANVVDKSKWF